MKRDEPASATGATPLAPSPELEGMLKRILDQTTKLEAMPIQQMSPENVAQVDAKVQELKRDLQARELEITTLKQSGNTQVAADTSALSSKIKELETKLAEYAILEDDIADLSLYKEENIRLKGELEKLKGVTSPEPKAAPQTAAVDAPAAPQNSPDDMLASFVQAAEAEVKMPNTGDPMADFESTLKIEKQMGGAAAPEVAPVAAAPAPAAATAPPAAAATAAAPAAAKPAVNAQGEADDLFAEFASSSDDAGLDTDKMMAEMEALVSLQPTGDSALEESIDTDKMAAEAGSLTKS